MKSSKEKTVARRMKPYSLCFAYCYLLSFCSLIPSTHSFAPISSPRRQVSVTNTQPWLVREASPRPRNNLTVLASSTAVSSQIIRWAVGHTLGGWLLYFPFAARAYESWYRKINLPPWTPPAMAVASIWTVLYSTMGVATGRIYQSSNAMSAPLRLWMIHVMLNLLWAPVFFCAKRLRLGMVMNAIMVGTLSAIIPLFYRIDKLSGLLLLPYLSWLYFISEWNNSVCRRNPTSPNGYNNAKLQSDLVNLEKTAALYASAEVDLSTSNTTLHAMLEGATSYREVASMRTTETTAMF